jgi:hypothetical protein
MAKVFLRSRGRQLAATVTALAVIGTSVALFQNCTQAANTGQNSASSLAAQMGFAYAGSFDQIAYMSCTNFTAGNYDPSAYFTIRAGAYRTGGIGLTQAFYTATTDMNPADQAAALALSPLNANTTLQAAVRNASQIQSVFYDSSLSAATEGTDYANFFGVVGDADVTTILMDNAPNLTRVLPPSTGLDLGANRFEATLMFGFSATLESMLRAGLGGFNTPTLFTLTYANNTGATGSSPTQADSPGDPNSATGYTGDPNVQARFAYGTGLQLSFQVPTVAGISSAYGAVALKSVEEIDLQAGGPISNQPAWQCPTSFQFQIWRANTGCPQHADPEPLSSDLQAIRLSLRVEDWYIDMPSQCIVSKKPGPDCYGSAASVGPTNSATCGTSVAGAAAVPCTAFASICARTQ